MTTIWERGPCQYCVRIRRKGVSETKTFETGREAEEWARIVEGKVTGDEFVDRSKARGTTLSQPLRRYARVIVPKAPRSAKMKMGQVAYWKASRFADWSLLSPCPWNLLNWRREVLDEDNSDDGGQIGPEAAFSAQTCVHRLNLISHLYGQWSLIHQVAVENTVVRGVRPVLDNGRNRRLDPEPDQNGKTEEDRLYEVCEVARAS